MVSKYLLVVHDDSASDTITQWLDARKSPANERWTTRLNRAYALTIVAPEVRDCVAGRTFTAGVVVSTEADSVSFARGMNGRGRRVSPSVGSFVRAGWSRDELVVEHDLFGAVQLLQAHGPGFVAFSDSLLVLTDLRARFGLINTPAPEALIARSGLTTRTGQQLGTDTIVREIGMAPPGARLVVDCKRPLLVEATGEPFASQVTDVGESFAALRATASFLLGSLRALAARGDGVLRVSGGRDSEILLQAALRAGSQNDFKFETDAGPEAQTAIALGRSVDLPVLPVEPAGSPELLRAWASSALGLYDTIASLDVAPSQQRASIVVDALGAKLLRRTWGSETASVMTDSATTSTNTAAATAKQLRAGLAALGAEAEDPSASEQHYAAYRSGVHAAASSSLHGVSIHPMQLLETVAAASGPLHGTNGDSLDALDALDTLVRGEHFEVRSAADARGTISLAELGGALDETEITSVAITGSPDGLLKSTVLALQIAADRGFSGEEQPLYLAELSSELLDVLPQTVREVYTPLADNARWQLLEQRRPIHRVGPSLAKLLSLSVFVA